MHTSKTFFVQAFAFATRFRSAGQSPTRATSSSPAQIGPTPEGGLGGAQTAAVAQRARAMMERGGSILTLTYYGAEKVVPHYNVMGVAKASLEASTRYLAYDLGSRKIRVNCISAGPVNTLAARGISGFSAMLKHYQEHAPLKRSCEPSELGQTGLFLASDGAAAITGQVIYVDGGYQIMGM